MLNKFESKMEELSNNFNKEQENIIKNQSEMMNTIAEMKKIHWKKSTAA